MGLRQAEPKDPMLVYEVLRRLGHEGSSEDEICERVMEAASAAGVRVDAIAADHASRAPCGSEDWRINRAGIVSTVLACLARRGRLGVLVADADAPSREPDGDRVEPGTADGEGMGRPLRYDRIFAEPVSVTVGSEEGIVRFPPFDGRVRVERGGGRPRVAALDDLREDDRRTLASKPARRRLEVHVRCTVPGCGQAFRAWISPPSARGGGITVEDTAGDRIRGCGFAGLFAARCPRHKRERRNK